MTGIRVFELVAIKVGHIRKNGLVIPNGKGGKKRFILLTDEAQVFIKTFLRLKKTVLNEPIEGASFLFLSQQGKSYTTRAVRKRVKYWFERCEINGDFSCHTFRRTEISHSLAAGINIQVVRSNSGHESLGTTSKYAFLVDRDIGDVKKYQNKSSSKTPKRNLSTNRSKK